MLCKVNNYIFCAMLKNIEKTGKRLLIALLKAFIHPGKKIQPQLHEIEKVLIFRLDYRVGNGIMLLPLADGIHQSNPNVKTDILIFPKVADFFAEFQVDQFNRIWRYDQEKLLKYPWKFIYLILQVRREKYDLVLACTNPDEFSLSSALFGRFAKGKCLVGFEAGDAKNYYDLTVKSGTDRHYADVMLDLWRPFAADAEMILGRLRVEQDKEKKEEKALFWLGATGKKHLSNELVEILSELIQKETGLKMDYAIGPDDKWLLKDYSKKIQNEIIVDHGPLNNSARFFNRYKLFVSTDTGPMHFAVAIGIPSITIFYQVNFRQYGYHDQISHFTFYFKRTENNFEKLQNEVKFSLTAMKNAQKI